MVAYKGMLRLQIQRPGLCQGYTVLRVMVALILIGMLLTAVIRGYRQLLADAQVMQIKATAMSLRTSVLQAKEQWYVQGRPDDGRPLEKFGLGNVVASAAGWPVDAPVAGELPLLTTEFRSAERCMRLWRALLVTDEVPVHAAGGGTADRTGSLADGYQAVTEHGRCRFIFTDPQQRLEQTFFIEYSAVDGRVTLTIR